MDARILKLILRNFKGARSLEIEMDGEDVAVYGRNATGKSTLFDAFTWCMFGKDSADRSDFWVKPHDEHGEEIHNLETVVEVVMSIDGTVQTFRHMLAENWVKKNGETERVYSGNTHSYWVNGVSRSAKEYSEAVSRIVRPEVFRVITNPMAFNAVKWDKRREFLLKLAPVDVDQIMLSRPDYQPIREAMEKHATDIYGVKKVKQEQRKRDNTELDMIPVRISEQTSTRDAQGDCDVDAARVEMQRIDDEIMRLDKDMSDGSEVADNIKAKADALAQAQKQYSAAKMDEYSARADAYAKVTSELAAARAKLIAAKNALGDIESRMAFDEKQMQNAKATLESTREEWYKVDEEEAPEYTGSAICPTCGQPIPEDQIEAARQRHIEQYQADKERRLEAISNRGKVLAQQIATMSKAIEANKAKAEELRAAISDAQTKVDSLTNEAKALEGEPDYSSIERIQQLQAAVDEARKAYDAATAEKKPVDESLVARKRELLARRDALAGVEAKRRQLDICNTRIAELEKRQRELGIQIADTEQFLMLVDRFVAERCSMLEESINSLFPTVRWSLFERQINGGMKDTCICLINGVQFSDANNAARINAGLEIIGVLSKHYGVTVPVFIDNAEAVNKLHPMDAQRIALIVTENDKTLRAERGIH